MNTHINKRYLHASKTDNKHILINTISTPVKQTINTHINKHYLHANKTDSKHLPRCLFRSNPQAPKNGSLQAMDIDIVKNAILY